MATIKVTNGEFVANHTLEDALVCILNMMLTLEHDKQFVVGQQGKLRITTNNGVINFSGSVETVNGFDNEGKLVIQIVPYLTGEITAPFTELQLPFNGPPP